MSTPARVRRPSGAVLTRVAAPDGPTVAVLVLHGGSADSLRAVGRVGPAALRLVPVARAIARSMPGAAVYRLRNSVRGWNGDGSAVLDDARWAVGQIDAARPGLAVVVVGHSLGGRVAVHLAGDGPSVIGAVVLAPWLEATDPVSGLRGVPVSVVQGTRDRVIPTSTTEAWLARAVGAGALVRRAVVERGEHTMLWRLGQWHRFCADGVAWVLACVGVQQAP